MGIINDHQCIYVYLYIHNSLGKFDDDLNQRPSPVDDGECKVNYPFKNGRIIQIRNYCNLLRVMQDGVPQF